VSAFSRTLPLLRGRRRLSPALAAFIGAVCVPPRLEKRLIGSMRMSRLGACRSSQLSTPKATQFALESVQLGTVRAGGNNIGNALQPEAAFRLTTS
jgi:hypothetical protein